MSTQPVNCGTSFCSCIECVALPREWVGLTDIEKQEFYTEVDDWDDVVDWVEAKLKEKNAL